MVVSSYLEFQTMGKVHKCRDFECYTPLSEHLRFHNCWRCYKHILPVSSYRTSVCKYVMIFWSKEKKKIKIFSSVITPCFMLKRSCIQILDMRLVILTGFPSWLPSVPSNKCWDSTLNWNLDAYCNIPPNSAHHLTLYNVGNWRQRCINNNK
jgi:hypothetical protein